MTGEDLKQLRHDLGEAIGRRLSLDDMGRICGLSPRGAKETMRSWEDREGPSGPVATLLSMLAWASVRHPLPEGLEASRQQFVRELMRAEILRRLS